MAKLIALVRNSPILRFLLPMGIFILIFGIVFTVTTPKEYAETVGTFTRAEEYTELDGDNIRHTYYEGYFTYSVDGKAYEGSFPGYSDPPAVGEKLTVYYDPANPSSVSNSANTGMIGMILIGVGALLLAGSVFLGVKALRQ